MLNITILKGLPGSGKSTWAKEQIDNAKGGCKRISKDDLRSMLDNSQYSKGNELFVKYVRDNIIRLSLENGKHLIIDDTNLDISHETRIAEIANQFKQETGKNVSVKIKTFDTPLDVCIERDRNRSKSVGETVIRQMYQQYIAPQRINDKLIQDEQLIKCIICDLDGTLAILNGRNPYDTGLCETDEINKPVMNILTKFSSSHVIVLVSGREDKFRTQTENWLRKHSIVYYALFMRQSGDSRKDSVVKKEIFDSNIKNKFYVDFVIDDRLSVCRMWHELGLHLFRVGNPDADF